MEGAVGTEEPPEVGLVLRKKLGDLYNVVVLPLPPWMFSDFNSMWFRIFVWTMTSSIMFHAVGALIAAVALRRHPKARFLWCPIMMGGLVSSLTVGGVLSGLVGFCYHNSGQQMPDMLAMLAGFAQSLLLVLLAFSRVLPTL